MSESEVQLLDAREMAAFDCEMPAMAVRVPTAGLVCAYARNDPALKRNPAVRLRAYAFVPELMSPLELQEVRVYIVPAMPDEIEHARAMEQHYRGAVTLGGVSDVFEACIGQAIAVTFGGDIIGGDGSTRIPPTTRDFDFAGELLVDSFELDSQETKAIGGRTYPWGPDLKKIGFNWKPATMMWHAPADTDTEELEAKFEEYGFNVDKYDAVADDDEEHDDE